MDKSLPLPYRVAAILLMGIWGWAATLTLCSRASLDVSLLMSPLSPLDQDPSSPSPSATASSDKEIKATITIATALTALSATSLVLFWSFASLNRNGNNMLPLSLLLWFLVLMFWPGDTCCRQHRFRFLRALARISTGNIGRDTRFADVILADLLTSYAKVLGDLWVTLCMLLGPLPAARVPDRTCGGAFVVPLVISYPYLIRLRQCLIEYTRTSSGQEARSHVANAGKYATALPVIFLSALQGTLVTPEEHREPDRIWFGEHTWFRLWILAVVLNSAFSFWWDVVRDWDLTLLTDPTSVRKTRHYGLRNLLLLDRWPSLYYAAIAVDFVLRMTWSLKLSPHLHHLHELEGGIFLLEALEVFRRWIWIFLRFETEWVRRSYHALPLPLASSSPSFPLVFSPEDIPLERLHAHAHAHLHLEKD